MIVREEKRKYRIDNNKLKIICAIIFKVSTECQKSERRVLSYYQSEEMKILNI